MKIRLLAIGALAMLAACQELNPSEPSKKGDAIKFANVSTSAGSPFTAGSTIGMFVGTPVNVNNAKFEVQEDGSLKSDTEVKWALNQTVKSDFFAYSPFNSEYAGKTNVDFEVAADQSTEQSFKASDLLTAVANAAPSDGAVNLTFGHAMTKLSIYFTVDSKDSIKTVEICDVYTKASLSLSNGSISIKGDKSSIVTAKAKNATGKVLYAGLIMPQTAKPSVKVTMSSDSVFVFPLEAEKTFKSGEQWNNENKPILIQTEQKPVELSFSVSDWSDGGELVFIGSKKEEEEEDYTTIAELASTATSTSTAFNVKVKNVIVTGTASSSSKKYAHMQDTTAGIMFFNTSSQPFSTGDCISGEISGSISLFNGYAQITSIDLSKATVTSAAVPAPMEVSVSELKSNIAKYYNRYIIVKGVTVTKALSSSNANGTIEQSGSTITIYSQFKQAVIAKNATGNLTGWPITYSSTPEILVYTTDQFQEGGSGEESAFTAITTPGIYDLTDAEAPSAIFAAGAYDQTGYGKASSSSSFNIFSFNDGWGVFETFGTASYVVDASTTVTVSTIGATAATAGSFNVKVAAKSASNVWFKDETNKRGYIISIK